MSNTPNLELTRKTASDEAYSFVLNKAVAEPLQPLSKRPQQEKVQWLQLYKFRLSGSWKP